MSHQPFINAGVVKDEIDPIADERLAEFVVRSHKRSHPLADEQTEAEAPRPTDPRVIDQALLRKYIMCATQPFPSRRTRPPHRVAPALPLHPP